MKTERALSVRYRTLSGVRKQSVVILMRLERIFSFFEEEVPPDRSAPASTLSEGSQVGPRIEMLSSVPGVGRVLSIGLLSDLPELGRLNRGAGRRGALQL